MQPKQPSFRRKPESRKSSGKRAGRLLRILDSGFRRNDGFVADGSATEGYVSRPALE